MQQRTVEHAPMPQVLEETVEKVRLASRERAQQRTAEQVVDVHQFSGRDRREGEVGYT